MEAQPSSALTVMASERAEVDTTRPFRSVKEAVAVFGERFLTADACFKSSMSSKHESAPEPIYALPPPKPMHSAASSPPSYSSFSSHFIQDSGEQPMVLSSLKKLETELEETKRELMLLKKREAETEIAVASLNAELHKSMSRLAEIEAAGVVKAVKSSPDIEELHDKIASERWGEERHGDLPTGLKYLPSLAQVLSLGEMDGSFGERRKKKVAKKKPIIPLIGDVFSRKKSNGDLQSPLYARPFYSALS